MRARASLFFLFVVAFLLSYTSGYAGYDEGYEILLVQTINRHGDRTAVNPIAVDPATWSCTENTVSLASQNAAAGFIEQPAQLYRTLYINNRQPLLGNCSSGQLSSIGQQQTFQLGEYLRELLIVNQTIISSEYTPNEIYVRTSETSRCQQTARNILEGLYPSSSSDGSSSLVIPMWTIDKTADNMQISFKNCPAALEQVLLAFIEHPVNVLGLVDPLLPHLHQLKNIYNTSRPILAALANYDTCNCRVSHDLPLPNGMSQNVFNAVQKSYWYGGQVLFNATASLSIANFANELLDFMEQKMAGTLPNKFQLFSGHDTTVGPLLSLLGIYNGNWPPYASHLSFSLLENFGYFVQVNYNGNIMILPQCNGLTLCPYDTFKSIIVQQLPAVDGCKILHRSEDSASIMEIIADAVVAAGLYENKQ